MAVLSQMKRFGGVARTSTLIRAGVSKREISHAVAQSRLLRIKRGWVALPESDPLLIIAAQHDATLTCITRAKRLGLWVFKEEQTHVAAKPHGRVLHDPRLVVHRHRALIPRDPNRLEDSLINTLALVSACSPHDEAVATWNSALNKSLIDIQALEQLPLPSYARRVLADCTPLTDSGLETYLRQRLGWLREPIRLQISILGHRVDVLIGDRLVIQLDGAHHVGLQRDEDTRHDALLNLHGYTVFRFSYRQLIHEWPHVQDLITHAIANGLHRVR